MIYTEKSITSDPKRNFLVIDKIQHCIVVVISNKS